MMRYDAIDVGKESHSAVVLDQAREADRPMCFTTVI